MVSQTSKNMPPAGIPKQKALSMKNLADQDTFITFKVAPYIAPPLSLSLS